jgi:transcriptional regulator with XRE-family HTH domain
LKRSDRLDDSIVEKARAIVASRIKEYRKRRGLTQIELAKISDVGRATIAALETGKRKRVHPATRLKLAKALKVEPRDLD